MQRYWIITWVVTAISTFVMVNSMSMSAAAADKSGMDGAQKAIAYLQREVPRWNREHRCFSCHNNGDGAAALLHVKDAKSSQSEALTDTLRWLATPRDWKNNHGDPAFADETLATVQFASTLQLAVEKKLITATALADAADVLVQRQHANGSWPIEPADAIGSPATYGTLLATVQARRLLATQTSAPHVAARRRAELWLAKQRPRTVIDAAALLWGADHQHPSFAEQRDVCLDVIRRGYVPGRGWGPFVTSGAEPFDSALVLLALSKLPKSAAIDAMIHDGRKFLLTAQHADGSWQETTRPPNAVSYAQRISTTAWALRGLLATIPE